VREPAGRVTVAPVTPGRGPRGELLRLGSRRGCEPGQEDAEPAFEFGGAVVAGQDGGEAAQQGDLADRQPVQAEAEQVVGLVGADGEFLELRMWPCRNPSRTR
jgi:hypothetical protein